MFDFDKFRGVAENYWEAFLYMLPRFLGALLILILAIMIARWIGRLLNRKLTTRLNDPLLGRFLAQAAKFLLVLIGFILSFQALGLTGVAGGLLAGAGIGAFIIGFAFKDIGENFLAGVILAFNRPFNVGDTIEVLDAMGRVVELNLRTTHIKTADGKDIYLPNSSLITQKLVNYTIDGFLRMDFLVGIDPEDDVLKATDIIMATLQTIPDILQDEEHAPFVTVNELSTSTVNLKVFLWLSTYDYRRRQVEIKGEAMARVKDALAAAGITMPADVVELKNYKDRPMTMSSGI